MSDHRSNIEADLHDAVQSYGSSVQPGDRLGEIRRATRRRSRPSWQQPWLLAAGTALATAAVVVGAFVAARPAAEDAHTAAGTTGTRRHRLRIGQVGGQRWLYPSGSPRRTPAPPWTTRSARCSTTGLTSPDATMPGLLPERQPGVCRRVAQGGHRLRERGDVWRDRGTGRGSRASAARLDGAGRRRDGRPGDDIRGRRRPVAHSPPGRGGRLAVLLDSPAPAAAVASPVTSRGAATPSRATCSGRCCRVTRSSTAVSRPPARWGRSAPSGSPSTCRTATTSSARSRSAWRTGTVQAEDSVSFTADQP
jgi:hypothetical protein